MERQHQNGNLYRALFFPATLLDDEAASSGCSENLQSLKYDTGVGNKKPTLPG